VLAEIHVSLLRRRVVALRFKSTTKDDNALRKWRDVSEINCNALRILCAFVHDLMALLVVFVSIERLLLLVPVVLHLHA